MTKLFSKGLEKTVDKELELQFQQFLQESEDGKHFPSFIDEEESFEDRLLALEEKLRERVFGLDHDVGSTKNIKRDKTNENLVNALCYFEKHANDVINEQLNPTGLLKAILDNDAPFLVCDDMYILGVERDRSKLFVPQKNEIAFQVAAQLIWYFKKNEIPTIDSMVKFLRSKNSPLYSLLKPMKFHSSRTIEDWVRSVFPLENRLRKGRPRDDGRKAADFAYVRLIQNVFSEKNKKVNFAKLRFIILCLSQMLKIWGLSTEKIKTCGLTQAYILPLPIHLHRFLYIWINEATSGKIGGIFDV